MSRPHTIAPSAPGGRAILEDDRRLLTREGCDAVWKRIDGFARGGGGVSGYVGAWWTGELRWGRNRVSLASDRRNVEVHVQRSFDAIKGATSTNQIDDASLEAVVRAAEREARLFPMRDTRDFLTLPPPPLEYPTTAIWSDATYNLSAEGRAEVARAVTDPAEAQGLLSAGYLEMRAQERTIYSPGRPAVRLMYTQAQCSLTVRDQAGSGSGWAGLSGHDWGAIDPAALAARALRKALASRNPVALEPGRYTVILEPQAVHDLVSVLLGALDRFDADHGGGPFTLGPDEALGLFRTKLGLKVADERVTIDHDPADPALGVSPFDFVYDGLQVPHRKVTWIDRGVLTTLADRHRLYAIESRNDGLSYPQSGAFRMSGGDTSVEEMIKTTKRGLLVTRFSNVRVLDAGSLLATGLTRDGLWLVENGAISKPVKNFRFAESPLFVLNSIEQLGAPVPVMRVATDPYLPGVTPAVVPPLKVRDFSFTSTIDAV